MRFYLLIALLLPQWAVNARSDCSREGSVPNPYPSADAVAPDTFQVAFNTSVTINGVSAPPIIIEVIRHWAPLGADRFHSLIIDNYYFESAFFRVVPEFVVQFGIASQANMTAKWDDPIPDDPVLVSNAMWTLSFATAGPGTRTTQIFINLANNHHLDADGFSPFAKVIGGFETALAINNPTPGNDAGINQVMYMERGNEWLLENYRNVSLITCALDGNFALDNTETQANNSLDYMLVYSFVSLSFVVAFIGFLFYARRRCCGENLRNSDHVALMDFSTGSIRSQDP